MGWLNDWWKRVTGRTTKPAAAPGPRPAKKPQAPASNGGLSLAEDPPKQQQRRHRSAGFDPYENDAGEAKPHAWERIDRD